MKSKPKAIEKPPYLWYIPELFHGGQLFVFENKIEFHIHKHFIRYNQKYGEDLLYSGKKINPIK